MTAHSESMGYRIARRDGRWVYVDTGGDLMTPRACKHCGKLPEMVEVLIPADLSHTEMPRWKRMPVDACISSLVRALQAAGIHMRGSCCGHGLSPGHIALQDGRYLAVLRDRHEFGLVSDFVYNARALKGEGGE